MARRRIVLEDVIARPEPQAASSLADLAALLDWAEIGRYLVGILALAKGEPGWPPWALFQALLLAIWHDLSDIRLTETRDDRASFRRLWGPRNITPCWFTRGRIQISSRQTLKAFAGATVLRGGPQVSAWTEVAVDHGVGWQEALRLLARLELLHLPLPARSRY